jgi:AAA15 family ATPase/GTPase
LKIQNFRQFDQLELKDIGNVVFLVGKNGSGKSSILELLWLFLTTLQTGIYKYGRPTSELTHLRTSGKPFEITVLFKFEQDELKNLPLKGKQTLVSIDSSFLLGQNYSFRQLICTLMICW